MIDFIHELDFIILDLFMNLAQTIPIDWKRRLGAREGGRAKAKARRWRHVTWD